MKTNPSIGKVAQHIFKKRCAKSARPGVALNTLMLNEKAPTQWMCRGCIRQIGQNCPNFERRLAQQAACDHLRLNFRSTFEDVEDTRVAEDAADLVFQSKAVAAMDLQGVVGRGPGDAGTE